ncbi:hypothetical protein [Streptomyces sp. NPDC007264]|uniref:hypothetical protein n=1 Tax=Streptomyces sp. NPDC007264 TaxID=3364777 RepID=UPI0036DE76BC
MSNPYNTAPAAPRPADTRPLYKRKRVWAGGFLLLVIGSGIGSSGAHDDAVKAAAAKPAPTVHVTQTVTATPEPKATVTKTAKPKPAPTVTVTKTARATSSNTGSGSSSSSSGGGSSASGTCSIRSNAGNCYSAGQFCRNSDHGASTTDASGTPITCGLSGSRWRWTY